MDINTNDPTVAKIAIAYEIANGAVSKYDDPGHKYIEQLIRFVSAYHVVNLIVTRDKDPDAIQPVIDKIKDSLKGETSPAQ